MTFQEQIYSHTNVAVKPKIGSSQGTRTNAPILGEQICCCYAEITSIN